MDPVTLNQLVVGIISLVVGYLVRHYGLVGGQSAPSATPSKSSAASNSFVDMLKSHLQAEVLPNSTSPEALEAQALKYLLGRVSPPPAPPIPAPDPAAK